MTVLHNTSSFSQLPLLFSPRSICPSLTLYRVGCAPSRPSEPAASATRLQGYTGAFEARGACFTDRGRTVHLPSDITAMSYSSILPRFSHKQRRRDSFPTEVSQLCVPRLCIVCCHQKETAAGLSLPVRCCRRQGYPDPRVDERGPTSCR